MSDHLTRECSSYFPWLCCGPNISACLIMVSDCLKMETTCQVRYQHWFVSWCGCTLLVFRTNSGHKELCDHLQLWKEYWFPKYSEVLTSWTQFFKPLLILKHKFLFIQEPLNAYFLLIVYLTNVLPTWYQYYSRTLDRIKLEIFNNH